MLQLGSNINLFVKQPQNFVLRLIEKNIDRMEVVAEKKGVVTWTKIRLFRILSRDSGYKLQAIASVVDRYFTSNNIILDEAWSNFIFFLNRKIEQYNVKYAQKIKVFSLEVGALLKHQPYRIEKTTIQKKSADDEFIASFEAVKNASIIIASDANVQGVTEAQVHEKQLYVNCCKILTRHIQGLRRDSKKKKILDDGESEIEDGTVRDLTVEFFNKASSVDESFDEAIISDQNITTFELSLCIENIKRKDKSKKVFPQVFEQFPYSISMIDLTGEQDLTIDSYFRNSINSKYIFNLYELAKSTKTVTHVFIIHFDDEWYTIKFKRDQAHQITWHIWDTQDEDIQQDKEIEIKYTPVIKFLQGCIQESPKHWERAYQKQIGSYIKHRVQGFRNRAGRELEQKNKSKQIEEKEINIDIEYMLSSIEIIKRFNLLNKQHTLFIKEVVENSLSLIKIYDSNTQIIPQEAREKWVRIKSFIGNYT